MNAGHLHAAIHRIADCVAENCDELVRLDQQNGDGDLGISMMHGFEAVAEALDHTEEKDLGRLFQLCSSSMNEAAPSTLGTILSLWALGMAKALKGQQESDLPRFAEAMDAGVTLVRKRTGSNPGEKTVLDALCPAVEALKANTDSWAGGFSAAARAAADGSENTRTMLAVHGRAAYYGEKSLGVVDGGSVLAKLLFAECAAFCEEQAAKDGG